MATFTLTNNAEEDMKELKSYSLKQFGKKVTHEYLSGMLTTLQSLTDNWQVGRNEAEVLNIPDVRSFPYMRHMIYYISTPPNIVVIGILHQSRLPCILQHRYP
ncbi:type II toxin-antitoxin system RelE/ParE family toxin [Sodalis praecaptivus]|uniref:type II toxin-antitoxin system RelE/ParE family toxin n=1 Tax=Sodalis praecaptivus TaxID=1239307 RepID=UPI0037DA2438